MNLDPRSVVLIVDDMPENIDALVGVLRDSYRLKVANGGEAALRIAASNPPPDLILLDVSMPGMDGYEVCRHLKLDPATSRIPIIFVTVKGDTQDESLGFSVGAVDYITKPISAPLVMARVATQVALNDQRRHLEGEVRRRTAELESTRLEIIRRLGRAAEFRDNETGMHVIRMSHYSRLLALAAGMSTSEADLVLHASPMHDVGKIGIPDQILLRPGPLDASERGTMQRHCAYGREIIGDHPSLLLRLAATVAYEHHEKWDGTGYPRGVRGNQIHPHARIVAVADVFDALTSKRPYKDAWPVERAVALLQEEAGRHFEPGLVQRFVEILPEIVEIRERFAD